MKTRTTISISEARKRLFEIAEKVQKPSVHYILTKRGKPKVAFMSAEEFESWQETLGAMHDFPDLEKDIRKAEKEYKQGYCSTLEDVLLEQGFIPVKRSGY
jgi:antitoxin YefM